MWQAEPASASFSLGLFLLCSAETSGSFRTTGRCNPQDRILQSHLHENFKSDDVLLIYYAYLIGKICTVWEDLRIIYTEEKDERNLFR
jgi:hypothetical protein